MMALQDDQAFGFLVRRGEARLQAWGQWAAEDTSKRLGVPDKSPFARLYAPDLGDVWEQEAPEVQLAPDDAEAQAVERVVVGMPFLDRTLLYYAYVMRLPVSSRRRDVQTVVRRMRMSSEEVESALRRLCEHVGRMRL